MTKYGRMTSDVRTTDPDSKEMKTKCFRGTGGVLMGRGYHNMQNIVFYTSFVNCINLIVTRLDICKNCAGFVSLIFASNYSERKQSLGGVASENSRDL